MNQTLLELTADIVAATVEHNRVANGDVPRLITAVHDALAGLAAPTDAETVTNLPAVSVRSSLKPDSITCLECGAVQKTLKRHLGNAHGLSPEQYRVKWKLPADYPMTAPNNSAERSRASKARGFGRKAGPQASSEGKE